MRESWEVAATQQAGGDTLAGRGATRWFRQEVRDPNVSPVVLRAFAASGEEIERTDLDRPLAP